MKISTKIGIAVIAAILFFCATQLFGDTSVSLLQRTYTAYNEQYFGDKLPKVDDVAISLDLHDDGFVATTDKGLDGEHFRIRFNMKYAAAEKFAQATLLHEMCHMKTWDKDRDFMGAWEEHGKLWRSCMLTLDSEGAFRDLEIDNYREVMNGDK